MDNRGVAVRLPHGLGRKQSGMNGIEVGGRAGNGGAEMGSSTKGRTSTTAPQDQLSSLVVRLNKSVIVRRKPLQWNLLEIPAIRMIGGKETMLGKEPPGMSQPSGGAQESSLSRRATSPTLPLGEVGPIIAFGNELCLVGAETQMFRLGVEQRSC